MGRGRVIVGVLGLGVLLSAEAWGAQPPRFYTVLVPEAETLFVNGVTADGRTAALWSKTDQGDRVFLWTPGGTARDIGQLPPENPRLECSDLSNDGSVLVGGTADDSNGQLRPLLSLDGGVPFVVGQFTPDEDTYPYGVSGDGRTMVGIALSLLVRAWRYDVDMGGYTQLTIPDAPSAICWATGASFDAGVIVGTSLLRVGDAFEQRAQRWLGGSTVATLLDMAPGAAGTTATGVSEDGVFVVGSALMPMGAEYPEISYRWSQAGGYELIQPLAPFAKISALDTDGTGACVVGQMRAANNLSETAFVWRDGEGVVNVETLLADAGYDMTGVRLYAAARVSADGRTVVGRGFLNGVPLGWAVEFGCAGDFDGDGFVSGTDFDLYVQAFEAGEASADFDRDGFVTGADFDLFVGAFEAGC